VTRQFTKSLWMLMLLAVLVSCPPLTGFQAARDAAKANIERDFQAAMKAQDSGDLERAETLLYGLHNAHPGIFAVDESLGMLLVTRGDPTRALPLLEAAVHDQPNSDVAHANLGAALYQLHRNQSALTEFEQAVKIEPGNASAQQSLGRLYMENQKPNQAAKALLATLRLKPEDTDLKLDCITALLAANRTTEARTMLLTILDTNRSARAQSLLGEADEKEGKFQTAAEHFALAAKLEPSEENAWLLGIEFLRHWTFDAAVTEFEAASVMFPDSVRMRLGLGAALFGDAKYVEAVPVFADLLASEPDNAVYAGLLGISCNSVMQGGSPRCAALTAYAQTHPGDAKTATYAASLLLLRQSENAQNVELARQLLQHALAADPNLPEAELQMGIVLQNSSNWTDSIPYLERAIKLKPDFAQAHYRLALAYWRTGRKEDGKVQMDLQKKFARQEEEDRDRHLRAITTFVVDVR
jgi:tetratricopeptide (TPR) repeat protein